MDKLIERIEAAEGPCRELDAEIARTLGWTNAGETWFDGVGERLDGLPAYTASLDAAMTLIPCGWSLKALEQYNSRTNPAWGWAASLVCPSDPVTGVYFSEMRDGSAALVVCAAALKAREARGE